MFNLIYDEFQINFFATIVQGIPKKVTIGPTKPQFLSETFEIFVVGRLFYSGLSAVSDLKNFDFKGPKSKF